MLRLLQEVRARCPKNKFPDDYIVFDTETSGINIADGAILQIGVGFVRNKKLTTTISQNLHRERLDIHPKALEVHGLSLEKLAATGVPAFPYIASVSDMFAQYQSQKYMFVGHNLMAFDAPFFERESRSSGKPFKFGDNDVIDTGMLVKASQLGVYFKDSETLRDFYLRVAEMRVKGIKWSLDSYCFETYNLKRFGVTKAHDAGEDCKLTHYLLEELRSMCNGEL